MPVLPATDEPCRILITGVGGTGVITVGALLGMAAYLDGLESLALDMTGLAQKGGSVMSHVQLAKERSRLHASRIAMGEATVRYNTQYYVQAACNQVSSNTHSSLPKSRDHTSKVHVIIMKITLTIPFQYMTRGKNKQTNKTTNF